MTGNLASPGFPDNYPSMASCYYEIRVPADRRIVLDLHFYDLETGRDHLEIKQAVSGSLRLKTSLTGTINRLIRYISAENKFILRFTSNGSVQKRGFSANYFTILASM